MAFGLERSEIKSHFQTFVLFAPILFFPFLLADFGSLVQMPSMDRMVVSAIQNILFFNTLHVAITFFFLVRFREFRNAIAASTKGTRGRFFFVCVALVLLGPLVYMPAREGSGFDLYSVGTKEADVIFRITYSFLALNHAVWQVRGIGLSYGRADTPRWIKMDKFFFWSLIGSLLVARGFLFLDPSSGSVAIQVGFSAVSILIALVLMIQCVRTDQKLRAVFYFRLIYFPLVPFSTFAAFITPCFHGLEYIDYFRRMNPVGSFRKDLSFRMKVLAVLVVVVPSIIFMLPYIDILDPEFIRRPAPFFAFIVGLNFGLGFLHYYLDEKIFAFSNPETRAALGPFLRKRATE